jgi:hypothetical protein
MKTLYQDHLHPKLEVSLVHVAAGNRTLDSMVGGERSSKELLEQGIIINSEHLNMASRSACGYMNIHELH